MRLQSLGIQDFVRTATEPVQPRSPRQKSLQKHLGDHAGVRFRSSSLNETQKLALKLRDINRSPDAQVQLKSLSRQISSERHSIDQLLKAVENNPIALHSAHEEIDRKDAYQLLV